MDALQTWIVVGVPGLLLATVCFVGRSAVRALVGYVVLLAVMLTFLLVPGERISATVVGVVLAVLVANGRGHSDAGFSEHHEHRERFTRTGG